MSLLDKLSRIFKKNPTGELKTVTGSIDNSLNAMVSDLSTLDLQYLIGTATGSWLDEWGSWFGIGRMLGESDDSYQKRILAGVSKPKNTVNAIMQAAREYIGDPNAFVEVYEPYTDLRKFNVSVWGGTDKIRNKHYYTQGTIDVYTRVPITPLYRQTVDNAKAAGIMAHYSYYLDLGDGQVFDMSTDVQPKTDKFTTTEFALVDTASYSNYGTFIYGSTVPVSGGKTVFFDGSEILVDLDSVSMVDILNIQFQYLEDFTLDDISRMETVPDTPSVTEYPIDNEMYVLIMPAFGVNAFRSAWSGGRSGWLLTGDETYSNIDKTLRIRFNPDIPVFPASTIVRTTVVEAQPKSDVGSQKDISWIPVGRATFSDPYNVYSGTIVTSGNRQFWGCDEVENTKDIGHELGHLTASSGRTLMSLWSYPISALWAMPDDTYRNEPVYGFGPKDSINSITTKSRVDGEAVSMLPPIRSSRAFRSGMAGELDRLSGARSGYILTEIDVAKPYSFIDSGIKLPVVSTYASGQFGIVVGTDKTQTISMMSYMTDNDPTYLTTGDAEVEQSIEIGAPRTPLSPTSPAQLDRYWNMIESQWETQHDPTIGSNESVRAAYIVTANTIMAWQGFTQLQDIYNVTVNQLSYMDDNHQLGIESQTLDASTNTVLNTIY